MTNKPPSKVRRPTRSQKLDMPRAIQDGHPMAAWMKGGPGPLLRKLAVEGAGGDVTLTADELARLVEEFQGEPLPETLRIAVTQHLRGRRVRRQGAPRKRQINRELVEFIMLPGTYAEALEDAKIERARLRDGGIKRGRYDDTHRLPTASSIACALVRKRLPTFKDQSDRSVFNLVSKARKLIAESDDDSSAPLPDGGD